MIHSFEKLSSEFKEYKEAHKREMTALKEVHRQELGNLKATHQEEITKLEKKIATLESENAMLKARLNKDSNNSSKPPSSDGYQKASPANSREKTNRPSGGQLGHKGHTSKLSETPDRIIDLNSETCSCGGEIQYIHGIERRQQIELQIHAHITEYRSGKGECSCCGKAFPKQFPKELPGIVNIGNRAKATIALLLNE